MNPSRDRETEKSDLFDQGMPDCTRPLGIGCSATGAFDQARAAIGKGARVSRLVQDAQGRTARQGAPPQLPAVRTLDGTSRKGAAMLVEILHHCDRGAQFAEGLEKQAHRFLYLRIRIEDDLPCGGIDKTNRQLGGQCTPGRLVTQAALETCTHGKELGFGHGTLQSEYQAIVEVSQILHRIGVIDQRLIETADLKQLLEVGIVAGQP